MQNKRTVPAIIYFTFEKRLCGYTKRRKVIIRDFIFLSESFIDVVSVSHTKFSVIFDTSKDIFKKQYSCNPSFLSHTKNDMDTINDTP